MSILSLVDLAMQINKQLFKSYIIKHFFFLVFVKMFNIKITMCAYYMYPGNLLYHLFNCYKLYTLICRCTYVYDNIVQQYPQS